jgi:hypothetical protein
MNVEEFINIPLTGYFDKITVATLTDGKPKLVKCRKVILLSQGQV